MASNFIPHICGKSRLHLPEAGCDDCARFERRLSAVEQKLEQKIEMSLYNRGGDSITAEVVGEVVD